MKPEISFMRHFENILPDRSDWLEGWPNCLGEDALLSFTDGSKTSSGTGAGVFTPDPMAEEWFRLGKFASVFQAETFAALKGILQLFPTDTVGKKTVIFCDSEANDQCSDVACYHIQAS